MQHQQNYGTGTVPAGSLRLESGTVLDEVELAYERCGPTNAPIILVCHALTGNHVAVGNKQDPGWWDGLIQPGGYIDTEQYQVITFNVLGGCDGSTGPQSIDPKTQEPYQSNFPLITVRDMVTAQYKALRTLGINHLRAVIGGSLGGMQVLEWGVQYPEFVDVLFPIATTPTFGDYGIAYNHIAKTAITKDPKWKDGQYTKENPPIDGLSVARMIGMVTYRSDEMFDERFDRRQKLQDGATLFEVESYLSYQGEKLTKRFDANSYLHLLEAMNHHDIGRKRGGINEALQKLKAEVVAVSFTKDLVYPSEKLEQFVTLYQQLGGDGEHFTIESRFGHDGFLVEFDKWGFILRDKLVELETISRNKLRA